MTLARDMRKSGEQTRGRLLQSAGEVFAARGFRSATIRELWRRANVNIASVNYHFSSKEDLYEAVLEFAIRQVEESAPLLTALPSGDSPENRLYLFVRRFMTRILDDNRPAWFGRLMAREILEPTGGHARIIDVAIRPLHEELRAIVRDIGGEGVSEDDQTLAVLSILGQCLFYRSADLVIRRLYPRLLDDENRVERAASHISRFSLKALTAPGPGMEDPR